MEATEKQIQKELNEFMFDLIKEYDAKGMRASGKWAESLEVETTKHNGKLTGLKRTEQLEYGRGSGRFPPIDQIENWIKDKNIMNRIDSNISLRSLAFLIARKISKEGWKRKDYGGVELVSSVITPDRIRKALERIGEVVGKDYISIFKSSFNALLKT